MHNNFLDESQLEQIKEIFELLLIEQDKLKIVFEEGEIKITLI